MRHLITLLCLLAASAHAQLREWNDYRTILWMSGEVEKHKDQWPLIAQRLKELGINTGMASRDDPPQQLIDSGFGYYVENIVRTGLCLKFRSNVTNWSKHVDEWAKTRSADGFVRDYSFDDPQWLASAASDVMKAATAHHAHAPLMYDLRDELSVTISANPFDYDFSPTALAGFREWLHTQYKDLAALNAGWDTEFRSWDDVKPFTTDQIKRRMLTGEKHPQGEPDWSQLKSLKFDPGEAAKNPVRWNLAPWCDHRTYMDISLARTMGKLRDTAHAKDPATPVGIEGLQMPHAFGGYDMWRLSQVLDWAEPYDVANSREILGSFMEGKPMVCTLFEKDTDHARRRLWHLLLLGDRGCIVWWSTDVIDWSKPDLPLTDKGKALAPVLKEMQSPLAKLFIKAKREWDPIAIHYSQPSIQIAWLLESSADGKTWPRRFSSYEGTHNQHAQVRNGVLKALQDMSWSPTFIADDPMKAGLFSKQKMKMLIEPAAFAADEAALTRLDHDEIEDESNDDAHRLLSIQAGPGWFFNHHGKLTARTGRAAYWIDRESSIPFGDRNLTLAMGWSDKPAFIDVSLAFGRYASTRVTENFDGQALKSLARAMEKNGLVPAVRVPVEARVRTHRFTLGDARLLAFERNIDYKMSEDLAQAGGNQELEKPVRFKAAWSGDREVYDLRSGKHLGNLHEIEVDLDPWQPSLYALLEKPVNGGIVDHLSSHQ